MAVGFLPNLPTTCRWETGRTSPHGCMLKRKNDSKCPVSSQSRFYPGTFGTSTGSSTGVRTYTVYTVTNVQPMHSFGVVESRSHVKKMLHVFPISHRFEKLQKKCTFSPFYQIQITENLFKNQQNSARTGMSPCSNGHNGRKSQTIPTRPWVHHHLQKDHAWADYWHSSSDRNVGVQDCCAAGG